MPTEWVLFLGGLLLTSLLGCTKADTPAAGPGNIETVWHSASGVSGGKYTDIVDNLKAFQRSHADLASIETYGNSVGGRPLFLLKLAKPHPAHPYPSGLRPVVVLTQTIHGNEYLGIVDNLPSELLANRAAYPAVDAFLENGGVLLLAPVANPDGYEANRRANDNGVDLNRDFDVERYATRVAQAEQGLIHYTDYEMTTLSDYVKAPKFTQLETRQLADAVSRDVAAVNGRVKLYFDYHCCQDENFGSLMHSWGDTKELHDGTIPAADIPRFEHVASLFKAVFPDHLWGSGYQIVQYLTFGTTDEWFYEHFAPHRPLTFCYEGQADGENTKLKQHANLWNRLLSEPGLTDPL